MSSPPRGQARLQAGLLARLARHPDSDAFVLRGGARIRSLLPAEKRPVQDIDLICLLPFHLPSVTRDLRALLAAPLGDGLSFEPDRAIFRPFFRPGLPGLQMIAPCGQERVAMDLMFGLPIWPPPERIALASGPCLGVCPETILARKLQVLAELGRARFRPKDLADLASLLASVPFDRRLLAESLDLTFEPHPEQRALAREALGHPLWWRSPEMEARWSLFASASPMPLGPLDATVAAVRSALLEAV